MPEPLAPDPAATPPAPLKRRRWPWVVLGLFVLLGLFVACMPTIMSLGVMRSYMVGRINRNLHGRLEIGDWSIGWSGSELRNVKVFDSRQSEILAVTRLKTSASFLDLWRGNYKLGATEVDEPNFTQLIVEPSGHTNLEDVFPRPRSARRGARGPKLDFSGDFLVSRLRATVVDRRDGVTRIIDPSALTLKIPGGKEPVTYSLVLNLRSGDGTQQSKHEGASPLPDELVHANGEPWPIGPAAQAGAGAILKALGRPITPQSAATQPTTRATSKPSSARHRPRSISETK